MLAEGEGEDYSDMSRPHRGPQPKPGDWYCPSCGDLQFARNAACRKCHTPNPTDSGNAPQFSTANHKHAPGDWNCPSCNDLNFARNTACRKCGMPNPAGDATHLGGQKPMRAGDWMCPSCNDHNYARNQTCRKCGEPCPEGCGYQQLPGDWSCPQCGDYQFAKNQACRRCQTPNPNPDPEQQALVAARPEKPMKEGDWHCPQCGDHQFARNSSCRRCGTPCPNPSAYMGPVQKPGDWYCPNCNDLQFARNVQCKRCGTANPSPTSAAGTSFQMKPGDWLCPTCGDLQFASRSECRKCGTGPDAHSMAVPMQGYANGSSGSHLQKPMKPGDWLCPTCGDLQFASRSQCRKCGTGPDMHSMAMPMQGYAVGFSGSHSDKPMKPGDWLCPTCGDLQFASRSQCRKCGSGQDMHSMHSMVMPMQGKGGKPMKPGDWLCPTCGDLQFASRSECRKCGTAPAMHSMAMPMQGYAVASGSHSQKPTKPGDWFCPNCGDHQFSKNTQCRRCATPKPLGGDEGHMGGEPEEGWEGDAPAKGGYGKAPAKGGKGVTGDQGRPKSWKCPSCNELVFARNNECKSCGTHRPENVESEGERSAPY